MPLVATLTAEEEGAELITAAVAATTAAKLLTLLLLPGAVLATVLPTEVEGAVATEAPALVREEELDRLDLRLLEDITG